MFTFGQQTSLSSFLMSLGFVTIFTALPVRGTPTSLEKQSLPQQQQLDQIDCLEVSAKGSGLYLQSQPTVHSEALGILPDGQQVVPFKNKLFGNGWLPISAPMRGYVFAGFLTPCKADTIPPNSNCSLSSITKNR